MSLNSRQVGKLAFAGFVSAAALGAPAANAALTAELNYTCRFPAIGVEPLNIKMTLEIPSQWPRLAKTPPFKIKAVASASGGTPAGLGLITGLKYLKGVTEAEKPGFGAAAEALVKLPGEPNIPVRVPITLDTYTVNLPVPDPVVLNANGETPPLEFTTEGPATITLTNLNLNLRAHNANDQPLASIRTPLADVNGDDYADIDGDVNTWNIPCLLDEGENLDIAQFQVVARDQVKPGEVSGLTATKVSDTSVKLNWNKATDLGGNPGTTDVKEYVIKYAGVSPAAGIVVPANNPAATLERTLTGLPAATLAAGFTVQARDYGSNLSAVGVNVADPRGGVVTPTPPGTPGATTVGTITSNSIALSWGAATPTDGDAVTYDVTYTPAGGAAQTKTDVSGTSTTLEGLTADTTYAIQVAAKDKDGTSAKNAAVSPKTSVAPTIPDTLAPLAPGDATDEIQQTDVTDTTFIIRWKPVVDRAPAGGTPSGIDKYVVRYEGGPAAGVSAPANATSVKVEGLGPDSFYDFFVTAVDKAGNESAPLTYTDFLTLEGPPANTVPTKPGTPELDGAASTNSLKIKWAPSTDDKAVTGYEVFNGNTKVATVNGTTTTATISGLSANTSYPIRVEALDASSTADAATRGVSAVANLKTAAGNTVPTKPGTPAIDGTAGLTELKVKWTAATDDKAVTGYEVFNGNTKVATVSGTTLTATITGLETNTSYAIRVEALDAESTTAAATRGVSAVANLKTAADTVAPSNPTVTSTKDTSSITLNWSGSTDNVAVTGYKVFQGTSTTPVYTGTATTYKASGLAEGQTVNFRVVAFDKAGNNSAGTAHTQTTDVTEPGDGIKYSYALAGSTTLKTLTKGNLNLAGGINAVLTLPSGDFTADLTLNDTVGKLTALGFLPITAKIGFVPSGKTTGNLSAVNVLTTKSRVRIKVKEVKLFGAIPLAGGNNCQTKALSEINLKSTQKEFKPLVGGPIAGTYSISDLNGCGALNGLVSPLTAGGGNTITLNLTPRPVNF